MDLQKIEFPLPLPGDAGQFMDKAGNCKTIHRSGNCNLLAQCWTA